MRYTILFSAALFLICCSAWAMNPVDSLGRSNLELRASRTTEPIAVDGALHETVWRTDPGFSNFVDRDPVEYGQPMQKTVVFAAFDDAALYIAAQLYDTAPDSIVGRLGRRDSNTGSDRFCLFLDPYLDRRSGYYFQIDAAGTMSDGTLYNDEWDDNTWDGVWEARAVRNEKGWTVEMRIPYSQIHFQKADKYVWGIDIRREVARTNETQWIVFTPKNGSGFVSRFARLTGIEDITPPRQLEVLPYVTTQAQFQRHTPGDPFNSGRKYLPGTGADLKMGIGTNLTLNATINPDFGQVEVDPAVVNLSDVETSFGEKRPFFIEGANIFDNFGRGGARNYWGFNFPNADFFYSRRIGRAPQGGIPGADYADVPAGTHILGAAKLTGKVGEGWNIGTINAVTRREMAELETAGQRSFAEVEPLTYYGIYRAQKEINDSRQGVGFLSTLTARRLGGSRLENDLNNNSFAFGLDGWTFLDEEKEWVVSGYAGMSSVHGTPERMLALQRSPTHYFQRPDASHVEVDSAATGMTGYTGRVWLNKQKGNMFFNAAFGFLDPKFNVNDLGYMSRNDVMNGHAGGGYSWTEPTSWYRFMEIGGAVFRSVDFGGNIIWEGVYSFVGMQLPNYWHINLNLAYNPATVNNRRTRGGPLTLNHPGRELGLFIDSDNKSSVVYGVGYYTYQAYQNPNSSFNVSVTMRPASNVSISVSPEFDRSFARAQWIGAYTDPLQTATYGKRYIFAELDQTTFSAGIRLNWTFTPHLSLQLYMQPLISTGSYGTFKELARPNSYTFNTFGENGSTETFTKDAGNPGDRGTYALDPDGAGGPARAITVDNPNFNIRSLRGNAVLRWEYLPGSTVYFVWTQSRSMDDGVADVPIRRSISRLLDITPDNIFMVKFSYWLSM